MVPTSPPDARTRWRDHLTEPVAGPESTIGVAASFTVNPLEPHLGSSLLDAGVTNPRLLIADFNQVHQACLDPEAVFGQLPQRLLLLWRIEDVFEADVADLLDGGSDAADRVLDGVAELIELVAQCAAMYHRPTVFGLPPGPRVIGADPLDVPVMGALRRVHEQTLGQIDEVLGRVHGIRLVDHHELLNQVGADAAHDDRNMLLYRQPYRTTFIGPLGALCAAALVSFDVIAPKAIVLDLDGTLWGGVVGDDGAANLAIGDAFPGNAFVAFQNELRRLSRRGVLLAVCSKNDSANVDEVFATRQEMVLTTDDIAAWRVNWEPKSANIAAIAEQLNLGLDSFVLIDDSAFELAEVAAALPEVRTLRVPDDPADLPRLLASTGWFRSLHTSTEDLQRTEMIQAEQRRAGARTGTSVEEFFSSLQLRVHLLHVRDAHVGRVTQLINRTNQFNLTTRRRTEADVAALIASPEHAVHAIEATDRFGSYGLVGVAITTCQRDGSWDIDSFLISCRVLRRGVESAFLAGVVDDVRRGDSAVVTGTYRSSAKNSLVAEFYPDHGFTPIGEGRFVLAAGDSVAVPSHIELVTDA